jgi:hypothetical protein
LYLQRPLEPLQGLPHLQIAVAARAAETAGDSLSAYRILI